MSKTMQGTMQEFLRREDTFNPKPDIREFPSKVIPLEQNLSVSITQRLEIVDGRRVRNMKSLFEDLSFEKIPFITNIEIAIRFAEMTGGFVSSNIITEPVHIGAVTGTNVQKNQVHYLKISEEEQGWTAYLSKYECRVTSSILGRIIGQCEFPE